jgi:hypothetical protein
VQASSRARTSAAAHVGGPVRGAAVRGHVECPSGGEPGWWGSEVDTARSLLCMHVPAAVQ